MTYDPVAASPVTEPVGITSFPELFQAVCANVSRVVKGKSRVVQLAVICMFSEGHLLIEDVPGVGKTVLSKSLAQSIGGRFNRVQFTPDLLPSDVIGTSVWNQSSGEFTFHPGPVFSNVLVADEVNRASPKTQSALLEAMAEKQVTVDGSTIPLQRPFMVIATQNPLEHHGTYPLPESQLDRFLMKVSIGYPNSTAERSILLDAELDDTAAHLRSVTQPEAITALIPALESVHVSDSLADYLVSLAHASRTSGRFILGISPRALIGLLRASKVMAASQGRSFVTPDDVKSLAPHVLSHRVLPAPDSHGVVDTAEAIDDLLRSTPLQR